MTDSAAAQTIPDNMPPLCVDLDGTLIKTDLLWESVVKLLKTAPWKAFLLTVWLIRGKASLKSRLAESVTIDHLRALGAAKRGRNRRVDTRLDGWGDPLTRAVDPHSVCALIEKSNRTRQL